MDDSQTLSALFPLFVVAMWLFVTGLLAETGGWRDLALLYRDPDGAARAPLESFWMASLGLRSGWFQVPMSYANCVIVEVSEAGLHLRMWLPFRFRHPPLLIPWTQMGQPIPGRILFFRTLTVQPRGVGTRIDLYGGPARAVERVWHQLAARSAGGALV